LKKLLAKQNAVKIVVDLANNFKSQDEEFAFHACKAIGSFGCDVSWFVKGEENELTPEEEELENNNIVDCAENYSDEDGNYAVRIKANVNCLYFELEKCNAADELVDIMQEVGVDNAYVAQECLNAIACLRGAFYYDYVEKRMPKAPQTPVVFSRNLTSSVLIQVAKSLRKYGNTNENVVINACRVIYGLTADPYDSVLSRDSKGTSESSRNEYNWEVWEVLQKSSPNVVAILADIARNLGVNSIDSAKDEAMALYVIQAFKQIICSGSDEKRHLIIEFLCDTGICDIFILLFKRLGPTSARLTACIINELSCFFQRSDGDSPNADAVGRTLLKVASKFTNLGMCELSMELYSKHRFFEAIYIGIVFDNLCGELMNAKGVCKGSLKQLGEANKTKFLELGIVKYFLEMYDHTIHIKLIDAGIDKSDILFVIMEHEEGLTNAGCLDAKIKMDVVLRKDLLDKAMERGIYAPDYKPEQDDNDGGDD